MSHTEWVIDSRQYVFFTVSKAEITNSTKNATQEIKKKSVLTGQRQNKVFKNLIYYSGMFLSIFSIHGRSFELHYFIAADNFEHFVETDSFGIFIDNLDILWLIGDDSR